MAWWIPFNKLRDRQTRYINEMLKSVREGKKTVYWVQGFAGTGKTTVLANLAVKLRADRKSLGVRETYCFITYTHAMKELIKKTFVAENKGFINIQTHTKFLRDQKKYDFVFLDEVQDISPNDLNKIKALSNFLFIAGDCEQSIYQGSAEETQIDEIFKPNKLVFTEILRLTKSMRDLAKKILPDSRINEGSPENTNGDNTPLIVEFDSETSEFSWIADNAVQRAAPGSPSCILFTHHSDIKKFFYQIYKSQNISPAGPFEDINLNDHNAKLDYNQVNGYFRYHKLPYRYLGNSFGELDESDKQPIVYVMTYHSSKGLDFDTVYIPQLNVNKQIVLPHVLEKSPGLDQRLLFVAVTRSRKDLFLTYSGKTPHKYITDLPTGSYEKIENPHLIDDDEEDDWDIF